MIRSIPAAILATLITAATGHAEGRVSYTADAGDAGQMKMTERWTGSALRTDIEGMDAYMLMRNGTIYSIISMAGQITVMDLGKFKDMSGAGAAQAPSHDQTGVVFPEKIREMRRLGESREIAGIEGEVHEIEWVDNSGQVQTDTAVLTDNSRLLEHQSQKMSLIESASGEAPNTLLVELDKRGLAALSFGDRFLVTAVGDDPGPAGDFELPAEPVDFGGVMNMSNQ
ncbi:hypothetical protein [uncultured Roseovarius sp.]|uniref:hypothetical protein n=1 Tax=uncultured Roseovarius sp. TaxID=293344 RepID=UPI002610CF77|nr:hypothetical protein [uncultured Roseovarius sp.]